MSVRAGSGRLAPGGLLLAIPLIAGAPGCACGSSDVGTGGTAAGAASTTTTSTSSSATTTSTSSGSTGGSGGAEPDEPLSSCDTIPASSEPVPEGYPAGSKRIQGLPPEVEVFELPPPSEPLSWTSCGAGCLELETPWADPDRGALIITSLGRTVADQPWLALKQRLAGGLVVTRFGTVSQSAQAALVEHEGTGQIELGFSSPRWVGLPLHIVMVFYHDELSFAYGLPDGAAPACLAKGPGVWGPMTAAHAAGRWATAGSMQPIVTGLWPPGPDGADLAQLTAPNGDQLNEATAIGERFAWFGYGWDERYRLWTWRPGEPMAELVVAADPSLEDLAGPTADEATVAWFRGLDRYYDGGRRWHRVELMTHPLPITSLPITGTFIRQVPEDGLGDPGTLHGDYFAHFGHDDDNVEYAYVVRLSDGRLWKIPTRTPDKRWRKVMYLSGDEVALLEGHFAQDAAWADTVVRYELALLGPGEPP